MLELFVNDYVIQNSVFCIEKKKNIKYISQTDFERTTILPLEKHYIELDRLKRQSCRSTVGHFAKEAGPTTRVRGPVAWKG